MSRLDSASKVEISCGSSLTMVHEKDGRRRLANEWLVGYVKIQFSFKG